MTNFELTPLQHRMIAALHTHDRALLLTPPGSGRRTAIVHALPDEGPIVWVTRGSLVEMLEEYIQRFRPGLKVTFLIREDLSKSLLVPIATDIAAGGTLVIGASAGTWLGRDNKRCTTVARLARPAKVVWGHGSRLAERGDVDAQKLLLHKVKLDLGMPLIPTDPTAGVISLGWAEARPKPPEFDPQPLLVPVDLDLFDGDEDVRAAAQAPIQKASASWDDGPKFFRGLGD